MNREPIQSRHLEKLAFVYLRQSSITQVKRNTEGEERQRRMQDVIEALGWPRQQISLLRGDTGNSGGSLHGREDYQRMLAAVLANQVGIIGAWELSRLVRDNQDWNQLVRICRLQGVLLADEHRVYDSASPQDRVLLGIQGAFNEYELSMITARMQQSRQQKATRGELYESFPAGYVCRHEPLYEKHPDERVQRAIEQVFQAFEHAPSVLQMYRRLLKDGFQLPTVPHGSDWREVRWVTPKYQQLMEMLRNPTYAGIYARGRCKMTTVLDEHGHPRKKRKRVSEGAWEVFLENHHEPYVSLETWRKNVQKISSNAHFQTGMTKPAPQKGSGLMAGLLRCRRCGHKLHATYRSGQVSYVCRGGDIQRNAGARSCFCFHGAYIEAQLIELILEILQPASIAAAAMVEEELTRQWQQQRRLIEDRWQACREQEARAAREYKSTDETYVTVRQHLAQEWESALLAVREQECQLQQFDQRHSLALSSAQLESLGTLAKDVRRIWQHAAATNVLKKQIVRVLIEEIVADVDPSTNEVQLIIHWAGGQHSELRTPRQWRRQRGRSPNLKAIINTLRKVLGDGAIAGVLNRHRLRTPEDKTWDSSEVAGYRQREGIAAYDATAQHQHGWLTQAQAATSLKISPMSVTRLVQIGILPAEQPQNGLPTVIRESDLHLPRVQQAVRDILSGSRQPLSQLPSQRNLFENKDF